MKKIIRFIKNKRLLLLGTVIIPLVIAIFFAQSVAAYKSATDELFNERSRTLNEITEQISTTISITTQDGWRISSLAFSHLLAEEIETSEGIAPCLRIAENGAYNYNFHLAVIDSDNNYIISSGETAIWNNTELLSETTPERQVFMSTSLFHIDKEIMIFLHRLPEAKVLGDGTRLTHTAMVLEKETYDKMFAANSFDGSADIFVAHMDGNKIYQKEASGAFPVSSDITTLLKDVTFLHGKTYEDVEYSLTYPLGESFEFEYKGTRYFISVSPVTNQDWFTALIVPTEKIDTSSESVYKTVITIVILLVLILGLIISLVVALRKSKTLAKTQAKMNDVLKKAAETATANSKMKSEFFSQMSHDLRTPLNAIFGITEMAKDNVENPDKIRKCLDEISLSSNQLLLLVNDVLDINHLEQDGFTLKEEPFNIDKLLESCCSIAENNANKHGISFIYSSNGFSTQHYKGSPLYISKILLNIMSNAIKYTDEKGTIWFTAEEIPITNEKSNIRLQIKDNGIGISEEFLEHLFEPFTMENEIDPQKDASSGLGLSIAKGLVEKMGGVISVESIKEQGSTFTVDLYLDKAEATVKEEPAKKPLSTTHTYPKNSKVLLAEDNALNKKIACYYLEEEGLQVVCAENGAEAVDIFENSSPGEFSIILMDIMMPKMDGYTATRKIRESSHSDATSIPIIAMTANSFAEDVEKALVSGMNSHISKPIDRETFVSILRDLIK